MVGVNRWGNRLYEGDSEVVRVNEIILCEYKVRRKIG